MKNVLKMLEIIVFIAALQELRNAREINREMTKIFEDITKELTKDNKNRFYANNQVIDANFDRELSRTSYKSEQVQEVYDKVMKELEKIM